MFLMRRTEGAGYSGTMKGKQKSVPRDSANPQPPFDHHTPNPFPACKHLGSEGEDETGGACLTPKCRSWLQDLVAGGHFSSVLPRRMR